VRELRSLFGDLDELTIDKVATAYDHRIAGPLGRVGGDRLGWNLVVRARKPA
jgi:hypothetical protein